VLVKLTATGALPALVLATSPTLRAGLTVIVSALAEALRELASVTVRIAVYVPIAAYVWAGFCSVELVPSPKVHAYA
jgi:hypothetical protein